MALEALIQGARRRRFPLLALGAVIILMVVGLIIGALSEQAYRNQSAREAGAQARLLASSVTVDSCSWIARVRSSPIFFAIGPAPSPSCERKKI